MAINRREFAQAGVAALASTTSLLWAQPGLGTVQSSTGLATRIDQAAEDYLATRDEASLVLGVTLQDERYVKYFRSPDAIKAVVPDDATIFELGSITKLFTTITLAKLESDGLVALDDTIAEYLPSELDLPPEIASITLLQLATHTSGLPRVVDNFMALVTEDVHTCYARYKKEDLYEGLHTAELVHASGTKALYSIIGMGTLGHILELRTGKPYETLVQEIFCEPLGLTDTTTRLSGEQDARLAIGYDDDGNPVPNWDHAVLAPQGALRSTAHDMFRFAEANLRVDGSALSGAMQRALQPHFEGPGGTWGLGWWKPGTFWEENAVEGFDAWMHGGATAAYRNYLGICKEPRVAVLALSSYGSTLFADFADLPRIGSALLKQAIEVASG